MLCKCSLSLLWLLTETAPPSRHNSSHMTQSWLESTATTALAKWNCVCTCGQTAPQQWLVGPFSGRLRYAFHRVYLSVCLMSASNSRTKNSTVWVKKFYPPFGFLKFFPNGLEFLIKILYAYYVFTLTKLCSIKYDHPVNFYISQVTTHLSLVLSTDDEQRVKTDFFTFYETANS